jgi:hypothetical protein
MPEYRGSFSDEFDDVFPAVYVPVVLRWRGQFSECRGLVDSGADQTMIPRLNVLALGVPKVSEIGVLGPNGEDREQDTYILDMDVAGYPVRSIEAAATDWPFAIVGRDVLNDLVTELNGPALSFVLTFP